MGLNNEPIFQIIHDISVNATLSYVNWMCVRKRTNSSPLCAAYKRRWTGPALVQVMSCRLSGAKPLPNKTLPHCHLDNLIRNDKKIICENVFGTVVCEKVAILFRGISQRGKYVKVNKRVYNAKHIGL